MPKLDFTPATFNCNMDKVEQAMYLEKLKRITADGLLLRHPLMTIQLDNLLRKQYYILTVILISRISQKQSIAMFRS